MKLRTLAIAFAVLLGASSAQATMVAGWDFSQYQAGALTYDFVDLADPTLSANWSDLDTFGSPGIGEQNSGNFGVLDLGFQPADPATDALIPSGGSLTTNTTLPDPGTGTFNGVPGALFVGDGIEQISFNDVRMQTQAALDLVFTATLVSSGQTGSGWAFSLAALGFEGETIQVEVAFDGGSFVNVGSEQLTSTDTAYSFDLGGTDVTDVMVRLSLPGAGIQFDNVGFTAASISSVVPEPGTALLVLMGTVGLAAFGRRRL